MFAEWTSLSPIIVANSTGAESRSVLKKFSGTAGQEVAVAVVRQLAASTHNLAQQKTEPVSLITEDEVSMTKIKLINQSSSMCLLCFRSCGVWMSFAMACRYPFPNMKL